MDTRDGIPPASLKAFCIELLPALLFVKACSACSALSCFTFDASCKLKVDLRLYSFLASEGLYQRRNFDERQLHISCKMLKASDVLHKAVMLQLS